MKSHILYGLNTRTVLMLASVFLLYSLICQSLSAEMKLTKKKQMNSDQLEQINNPVLETGTIIQKPGNSYRAHVMLPFTDQIREVTYRVSKSNDAIYMGDINLGSAYEVQRQSQEYEKQLNDPRSAILAAKSDDAYRWRNGIVPYRISGDFDDSTVDAIKDGINELNTKTFVNIVPYEKKFHPDYVDIILLDDDELGGGSSSIGRQGGRQKLSLIQGADSAATMHEFMHALGFLHEHTRADRDEWVTVKWNNIIESEKPNFYKMDSDDFMFGSYDVESIMHYSGFAFSKPCDATRFSRGLRCGSCATIEDFVDNNGQCYITIKDRKSNAPFVRSRSLSFNDVQDINALYPEEIEGTSLPSVLTTRTLRTTVERVITVEGPAESGVCGKKTDYIYKLEAGPVSTQMGLLENALVTAESTQKQVDKPYRSNDFRPTDWRLTTPIGRGIDLVRVDIKLWDHDDLVCGGKDDVVDINPNVEMAMLHLLVDTSTGDLYYLNKKLSALPGFNTFPRGDLVGNIFDSSAGEYLTQKFNGVLDGRVDYKDESEIHVKLEIL